MEYLAGGSGSDIVSRLHPKATSRTEFAMLTLLDDLTVRSNRDP